MTIYGDLGEAEDGMRTLTPPHALTDAPEASRWAGCGARCCLTI